MLHRLISHCYQSNSRYHLLIIIVSFYFSKPFCVDDFLDIDMEHCDKSFLCPVLILKFRQTSFLTQPEIEHIPKYVSDTIYVLFSVQQAPICTYRTDKSFLHRRPAGVGRHSSDLWQIPRKERRTEGAVRKRSPEFLLPYKILGEYNLPATLLQQL